MVALLWFSPCNLKTLHWCRIQRIEIRFRQKILRFASFGQAWFRRKQIDKGRRSLQMGRISLTSSNNFNIDGCSSKSCRCWHMNNNLTILSAHTQKSLQNRIKINNCFYFGRENRSNHNPLRALTLLPLWQSFQRMKHCLSHMFYWLKIRKFSARNINAESVVVFRHSKMSNIAIIALLSLNWHWKYFGFVKQLRA